MKYKLIAIDMDGTFLNSSNNVSDENRQAVLDAIKLGVKVVISTGRSGRSLTHFKDKISFDTPCIVYNGCGVKFLDADDYVDRYDLDFESAKEVYEYGVSSNLDVLVWADDELYANSDCYAAEFYKKHTNISYKMFNDFELFRTKGIHKVLFIDEPEAIIELNKKVSQSGFNKTNYTRSLPNILEFFSLDGSKGNAVINYGKSLGIKPEEIIAIGDGMNDLSMIEAVGMGIAMGNAFEEVKTKAKFVTKTNDENGVAYAINKFVLNI